MPTITSLFGGHSPFKHLQAHMRVVHKCAKEVVPLAEAVLAEDRATVTAHAKAVFRLESEADELKHVMRINLPRSLFMPVDRRDLLDILDTQDSIADTAEDIAETLTNRKMVVPKPMQATFLALVTRCVDVVDLAHQIIEEMDELLEVGFRGRTAARVEALAAALNEAENETDKLERELAHQLFELESELQPVTVMFWYQLIEWIGDLADYSEKVGNNIRLIIAR